MSLRTILVIGLALFCGFAASFAVSRSIGSAQRPVAKQIETTPVVVAIAAMPRGSVVTSEMIDVREWPKELVPSSATGDVDLITDRVVLTTVDVGEPISINKLADRSSGRGLSALIPPGMRAYTIEISTVASNVAGFILPGSRVDVLLTLRGGFGDETGGGSTMTLLQAVEVLAVDQDLETPDENPEGAAPRQSGSVTLLITPDQAPVLDLGQNMGTLTLSLRNPSDTVEATTTMATISALKGLQDMPMMDGDDRGGPPGFAGSAVTAEPNEGETENLEVYEIRTLRGNSVGRIHILKPQDKRQ